MNSTLGAWATFYTMVGSSSAALTGLMFVVIGVIMNTARERRTSEGISIFTTPAVVHLGAVLLTAAILLAPWQSSRVPCEIVAIVGLAGIVYMLRNVGRTRSMMDYRADLEDWAWYNILPLVAYGAVCGGALWALGPDRRALFALAAGVVLLMFAGIRNAWDIVTYIAVRDAER